MRFRGTLWNFIEGDSVNAKRIFKRGVWRTQAITDESLMRQSTQYILRASAGILIVGFAVSIYVDDRREPVAKTMESITPPPLPKAQLPNAHKNSTQINAEPNAETNLREASSTIRNGTFLIAIHKAGYFCDYVDSTYESVDGIWLAECIDKRDYKIMVVDTQTLRVEPIPHRIDETF
jgi:hypothetical protein